MNSAPKYLLIAGLILAGFLIFFFGGNFSGPNPELVQTSPTPSGTVLVNSTAPTVTPIQKRATSNALKTAACQLSGGIRFIEENLYETKGAKISYQNVDDRIRQIIWRSEPDDGALIVGPNLFEELEIPNGEREVGVSLTKTATARDYILTARITYGFQENGRLEVRSADCSGKVTVTML